MARPSSKTSQALALVSDRDIASTTPVEQLQQVAVREFHRVAQNEQENALRAILLGLTLHKIKASLAHGEFLPWCREALHNPSKIGITGSNLRWTPATAQRNANHYMRLAMVAIEQTGATKPDLLALPGDQVELSLEAAEGEHRRFVDKLIRFVGDSSLNELLREHGIKDAKKLGGRRESEADPADDMPATPEQLVAQAKLELSDWVETGRQLLIVENVCARLSPEDLKLFVDSLHGMLGHWDKSVRSHLAS